MKYQRKIETVEAEQWFEDKPVEGVMFPAFHVTGMLPEDSYSANHHGCLPTPDGNRAWKGYDWQPNIKDMPCERYYEIESGDWIVKDKTGHIKIYKSDIFTQMFEVATSESHWRCLLYGSQPLCNELRSMR